MLLPGKRKTCAIGVSGAHFGHEGTTRGGTGTPSREYQRQEKRGRHSGRWRWSLTRSDARKNPLHRWVLQFGAGRRPQRQGMQLIFGDWRMSRMNWGKKGGYPKFCRADLRDMCNTEAVRVQPEALYRRSVHARIYSGLQEWCSRSSGDWPRLERSLVPKSMLVLLFYGIWLRPRSQQMIWRWWLWLWFHMSAFCEWRRELVSCWGCS